MNLHIPKRYIPDEDDTLAIWRGGELLYKAHNLRMRNSVLLLTECLKDPTNATGITHLALGSGIGNGTLTLPQQPSADASTLRTEVNRVPISSVGYDDVANAQGDTISDGTRTNRLVYYTEVAGADSDALVTEIALFGGSGASSADGGTMMSWITFPVIDNRTGGQNPAAPETLVFTWVLKFPYVNPEELVRA